MAGEYTAFFYGTLMAKEVFFSVCYNNNNNPDAICNLHTFVPATLDDHCRRRVKGADYPGVIAGKGHSVRGIYATGLTEANMQKLDYFEGSDYDKVKVKVTLVGTEKGKEVTGEVKDTNVYIFLNPKELEEEEWDFEHFRTKRMKMWTRGDWAFDPDTDAASK